MLLNTEVLSHNSLAALQLIFSLQVELSLSYLFKVFNSGSTKMACASGSIKLTAEVPHLFAKEIRPKFPIRLVLLHKDN